MENTIIKQTLTEVTFFDSETEEVKKDLFIGKRTVKECKEFIPANAIYITKEVKETEFELPTEFLLKHKLEKGDN